MLTLYHGTNLKALKKIKIQGIKPRNKKKSNWETGIGKSRPDLVYLTNCYACYYANASCQHKNDEPIILKLKIDPNKIELYPDEEFIFRIEQDKGNISNDPEKAIEYYETIDPIKFQYLWQLSLEYMGTITTNFIPPEAIIGYAEEPRKLAFAMNCDPCISIMNYKICGEMYKEFLNSLKYKKL